MLTATKPLVGGACAAPSSSARRRTFVVPEARRKPGNGRRTSVSKVGSTSTSTTTTTTTTLSADSNGAAVGTVTRPDVHVQDRTHATEMKATVTVHMSKAAGVRDFLYDLILKTWLHVDLVSSELDPQTGQEREPISGAVKHSGRVDDEWDMYEATFKVPASFGPIGAVQVTNYHHSEMLLGDIEVFPTGQEESAVTFHCKSWIDPSHCTPDKRVFFPAHSYLPSQTPKGVEGLRKRELEILRGTGCGERKEHDRIYDYDVYNDLGNPDDDNNPTTRPVLGGKEHPYPRRCRTGRPRSKKDPFSEERSHKEHIYVPRDEAFTERKMGAFDTKKFMSQLHALTTGNQQGNLDVNASKSDAPSAPEVSPHTVQSLPPRPEVFGSVGGSAPGQRPSNLSTPPSLLQRPTCPAPSAPSLPQTSPSGAAPGAVPRATQQQFYPSYPSAHGNPSQPLWGYPPQPTSFQQAPFHSYPPGSLGPLGAPMVGTSSVTTSLPNIQPPGITTGDPKEQPSVNPGSVQSIHTSVEQHPTGLEDRSMAGIQDSDTWSAHKTEAGVLYYYNALTGESTYQRPPGYKGGQDQGIVCAC